MKKVWVLITLAVVMLVSVGQSGCQKKEKPAAPATVETKKEETKSTEVPEAAAPAAEAPKDHPAH